MRKGETTIKIVDVTGSPVAVSTQKAQLVYELVADKLRAGEKVALSFEGVRSLISAFLNVAIGQLYGTFPEDVIRANLRVVDTTPEDRLLLKDVVERAKQYFSDPSTYQAAERELIGNDAV